MAVRHDADPKALMTARQREAAKPGRDKLSGRGSGLTPRVRRAIELLVHGFEEDRSLPVSMKEAAERAGLSERTLKAARLKPSVEQYYQGQMAILRNGEKPASLRAMAAIRDDVTLKSNAAGRKVQLDAAKSLAFDPPGQASQTNIQVNVGQQVTPGYVIKLNRRHDDSRKIAHLDADETIPVEEVFAEPPYPMRPVHEEF